MSYRKLPTAIREKVLKYFDHRFKGKFFDERAILGEVSSPLRNVSPLSLSVFINSVISDISFAFKMSCQVEYRTITKCNVLPFNVVAKKRKGQ